MEPFTPPAPSRWSLCAEAGRLSPFGGPIDIWAKSVSRCRRLQARPADSRRTAAQVKPTLPSMSSTSWGSRAAYWIARICHTGTAGPHSPSALTVWHVRPELCSPRGLSTATGPCRCCAWTAGSRIVAVPAVIGLVTDCEGLQLAPAPWRTGHCGGDCLAAYFDADGSRGWSPVVLATAKPPVISVSRKMHRLLGTFGR